MSVIINGTNGVTLPVWTTATRPVSPAVGLTGFNSTLGEVEAWDGTYWSGDDPIAVNGKNILSNTVIGSSYGAVSVGPMTIANNITVTVSANARYVIL